jgi:hypothetical protein
VDRAEMTLQDPLHDPWARSLGKTGTIEQSKNRKYCSTLADVSGIGGLPARRGCGLMVSRFGKSR